MDNRYESSASWHRYRALLEQEFGVRIQRQPIETRQSLGGHDVHIDDWRPDGVARGTLILVHGAGGHGRVLAPLGDFAAGLGWRALAPDLPGYGLTRPSRAFRWDYQEWPAVVAELAEASEAPVVLVGLSVGGMTAVLAAQASPRVSGVVVTTLLDMADPAVFVRAARWRWLGRASLLGFRLMPAIVDRLSLPLWLAAPLGKMSGNAAMRDYFASDPLLGGLRVPSRFFRTMHLCRMPGIEMHCPLLLVHPGADRWTPTETSRQAYARIEGPKRLRELSNGSHLPLERPAFDELQQEIADFLGALA